MSTIKAMHLNQEVVVHRNHEFNSATAEQATQDTREPSAGFRKRRPSDGWVQRRAKLFEAGAYPDKGVTVTPEQLEKLAESFREPVPVLIEHAESPLELGLLTQVEALDGELFGTLSLSKEANDLVEKSGARSLSIGLSPDLNEIREVSLVRNPRVTDAQLFSGPLFTVALDVVGSNDPDRPEHPQESLSAASEPHWRSRYEELRAGVRREEAERRVDAYIREGRLCPAQAPFAAALLRSEDTIEFDGDGKPLRELLMAMIERQPPMNLFTAAAPDAELLGQASSALLLPEEAEFYRRHFPDVSLDDIAARKSR